MELVAIQWEFVRNITKLIKFIEEHDKAVTFGEAHRPYELHLLYLFGLSIEEIGGTVRFTTTKQKAHTKTSKHLKRLALDLNFFNINDNGEYQLTYEVSDLKEIGDFWESLNINNVWGGTWKFPDVTHFQTSY